MSQSQEVIAEVGENNTIVFKIQQEQNVESTSSQELFVNTQEESQDGSLTVQPPSQQLSPSDQPEEPTVHLSSPSSPEPSDDGYYSTQQLLNEDESPDDSHEAPMVETENEGEKNLNEDQRQDASSSQEAPISMETGNEGEKNQSVGEQLQSTSTVQQDIDAKIRYDGFHIFLNSMISDLVKRNLELKDINN